MRVISYESAFQMTAGGTLTTLIDFNFVNGGAPAGEDFGVYDPGTD